MDVGPLRAVAPGRHRRRDRKTSDRHRLYVAARDAAAAREASRRSGRGRDRAHLPAMLEPEPCDARGLRHLPLLRLFALRVTHFRLSWPANAGHPVEMCMLPNVGLSIGAKFCSVLDKSS